MSEINNNWSSILKKNAFWEQYFPEGLIEIDNYQDSKAITAALHKRFDLFKVTEKESEDMNNWLFGAETLPEMNPQKASPEILTKVDAMLAETNMSNNETLREHLIAKLMHTEAKPPSKRIEIPFTNQYLWTITFDAGVFHELHHPKFDSPLLLGYDDPHFQLPILRWQEVDTVIGSLQSTDSPEWVLRFGGLLMVPTVWMASGDTFEQYHSFLQNMFVKADIFDSNTVEHLVEAIMPTEETELSWRWDNELGWVNDGDHSRRNPENNEWTHEQFREFRRFLEVHGVG